ncbi:hypothetical protein M5K25_012226 [Dendrobium thyrsiflorum]|uniref:Uncharacterized protein n=1 Tax=Dendrobium thyrsiflorum TaxID=117978 RepID=A0ABD0UWF9_DENTH
MKEEDIQPLMMIGVWTLFWAVQASFTKRLDELTVDLFCPFMNKPNQSRHIQYLNQALLLPILNNPIKQFRDPSNPISITAVSLHSLPYCIIKIQRLLNPRLPQQYQTKQNPNLLCGQHPIPYHLFHDPNRLKRLSTLTKPPNSYSINLHIRSARGIDPTKPGKDLCGLPKASAAEVGRDDEGTEWERTRPAWVEAEGGEKCHGGGHVRERGEAVCEARKRKGGEWRVGEESSAEEANGIEGVAGVAESGKELAKFRQIVIGEDSSGFGRGRRRRGCGGGEGGVEDK